MHRSHRVDRSAASGATRLDRALLANWPLPVDEHGDKHSRGTVLVIGGSPRTPGAVLLAGEAALRMGAGRLQIATVATVATAVAVAMPESMVIPLAVDADGRIPSSAIRTSLGDPLAHADAVLLGPGLQRGSDADALLAMVVECCSDDARIVVDAEAIQSVGRDTMLTARIAGRLALTPNRAELDAVAERLRTGNDPQLELDDDTIAAAAHLTGGVITSFGEIAAPDGRRWATAPATPGLGTSGSGDVLAGLAVGACARTRDVAHAMCWATFVHEDAGNRLSDRIGRLSFIARDLLAEAPASIAAVEAHPT